jgi:DNA-binding GntR family transcriptional regulator
MNLPLDEDGRAPYLQTAEALRRDISAGRLRPGDKLPSSRELQQRYQIASATVQNALRVLRDEGLVYSVQGKGTFVRRSAADAPTAQAEAGQSTEAAGQDLAEVLKLLRTTMGQVDDLTTTLEQMSRRIDLLEQRVQPAAPDAPDAH